MKRCGWGLIDLGCILGIFVLIAGLLLPAVHRVHMAAERMKGL